MKKYLPIYLLLILAVATRFLPHAANFTAIGAIAMFSGLYLPRRWAIVGPLLAMFTSDIFLGFYHPITMLSVYISFILMTGIGIAVRKNKNIATVLGGTLLGSLIFYLITNLSVWVFSGMYTHTLSGLLQSYYLALPFFKNTIAGDLTYVTLLVGGYELVTSVTRNQTITEKA